LSWKKERLLTKGDETSASILTDSTDSLKFEWGLLGGVGNARGIAHGLTGIGELLEEDLGDDLISWVLEKDGEDNEDSLGVGLDEEGFVLTVRDDNGIVGGVSRLDSLGNVWSIPI